jgi:hypothetical protein
LLRRNLLSVLASGIGIGLTAARASAQQKVSPADAAYQDRPNSGLDCAACSLFRPPRSCEVVEGDISPEGWCRFFDLPD